MISLIVAFLLGAIVMDLLWAFKLGIPQRMFQYLVERFQRGTDWQRYRHRHPYSDKD
jgi:hypothetical protein